MDNEDVEGGMEDEFHSPLGGKYRPVVANDRAVLEMSSIDPGFSSSLSSRQSNPKIAKVVAPESVHKNNSQAAIPANGDVNGSESEHKLELFGFDSLVNILGLKSLNL